MQRRTNLLAPAATLAIAGCFVPETEDSSSEIQVVGELYAYDVLGQGVIYRQGPEDFDYEGNPCLSFGAQSWTEKGIFELEINEILDQGAWEYDTGSPQWEDISSTGHNTAFLFYTWGCSQALRQFDITWFGVPSSVDGDDWESEAALALIEHTTNDIAPQADSFYYFLVAATRDAEAQVEFLVSVDAGR